MNYGDDRLDADAPLGQSALERSLLAAAREEPVPAALKARMEQGLAAAPTATAGPLLPSVTSGKIASIVGVSSLVLGAALGFRSLWLERAPAQRASDAESPLQTAAPNVEPRAAAEASADDSSGSAQTPVVEREETLERELALLDEARTALRARQSSRALSVLARYAKEFTHGTLAPEAQVLTIEARMQSGSVARARAQARTFLRDHPESPLAARVRRLVSLD